MNKKLLAVAVASAMAAPIAAHADSSLTIYGGVIAVESIDNGPRSATAVNNNHSALGFEGSTDVNSNLAAVFHWDAFVNLDRGASNGGGADDSTGLIGGGRDGWAGLRGSFGTVALGFQGRPWKTLSHALDPFEGTIADYSSVLGRGGEGDNGFDTGVGNSIIWFGPNLNGFTWHAQYGTEDSGLATAGNNYGLQGNYSNDQFFVGASFSENENTAATGDDNTAFKVVGSVNFNNVTLTGAYEQLEGIGFATNADRDAFWLAATVDVGHGSIRASFISADDTDNATATSGGGADQFSVGYFGDLSDNSQWYVIYSSVDNDNNGNYGFRSDPSTSSLDSSLTGVLGQDSDAIALGIKYNFAADLI